MHQASVHQVSLRRPSATLVVQLAHGMFPCRTCVGAGKRELDYLVVGRAIALPDLRLLGLALLRMSLGMHMLCTIGAMAGIMLSIAVQIDQFLGEVDSHVGVLRQDTFETVA